MTSNVKGIEGNMKHTEGNVKHIKILSNRTNIYVDLIDSLRSKVYVSDYIVLDTMDRMEGLLKSRPFFSEYYVVEIDLARFKSDIFVKLNNWSKKCNHIMFVIIAYNKDQFEKLSFCVKSFNSYKITEKYFYNYMSKRLMPDVRLTGAEYKVLFNKLKYHYEMMDRVIARLNSNVSKSKVIKTTKIDKTLTFDRFWYDVMICREPKKVFKFLEEYRNGFKFMHKFFIEKMEELEKYYRDVYTGQLNDSCFKSYCAEKKLSEYKVRMFLDIISVMSYSKFVLIRGIIANAEVSQFDLNILVFKIMYFDKVFVDERRFDV